MLARFFTRPRPLLLVSLLLFASPYAPRAGDMVSAELSERADQFASIAAPLGGLPFEVSETGAPAEPSSETSGPDLSQLDPDGDGAPSFLDPDDDGDGLPDVVETDTGVFVSPTNLGTSPIRADSDGDGISDGLEMAGGSDPNDPASLPPSSAIATLPALGGGAIFGLLALAARRRRARERCRWTRTVSG